MTLLTGMIKFTNFMEKFALHKLFQKSRDGIKNN